MSIAGPRTPVARPNDVAEAGNRLSDNRPTLLLDNARGGFEVTVNEAVAWNATFVFKTGFSASALTGLLGSDGFGAKGQSGRVGLVRSDPDRRRKRRRTAGTTRSAGPERRAFSAPQRASLLSTPATGPGRGGSTCSAARASPSHCSPTSGSRQSRDGRRHVGTRSTPTACPAPRSGPPRRQRWPPPSSLPRCAAGAYECGDDGLGGRGALGRLGLLRGNADGLGGFTFVARLWFATLQATGRGLFGLYGSTAALVTC